MPRPKPAACAAAPEPDPTPGLAAIRARHGEAMAFALLVLAALLLYWPILGTGLLSDDWDLSLRGNNPWAAWHGHWFGGGEGTFYRPLSRLALYAQAVLFGHTGHAQHLVSLVLHVGIALWLYAGLRWSGHRVAGLVAAGLFLLHPAAVETVAWVSSQTDLLHLFFAAGSLALALRGREWRWMAASLACALLACLSKDTAILLGPTIAAGVAYVLVFVRPPNPERRRLVVLAAAHLGLWSAYLLARRIFLGAILPPSQHSPDLPQQLANLFALLHELLLPFASLFADRAWMETHSFAVLAPLVVLPAAALAAAFAHRHALAIALGLFGMAAVPYMRELDQSIVVSGSYRFFYHPLLFFAAAVALAAEPFAPRTRASRGIGLACLLGALLALRCMWLGGAHLADFTTAAEVRRAFESEMEALLPTEGNRVVIAQSLPDRIGGAYVFRNGFESFVRTRHGDGIRVVRELTLAELRPDIDILRTTWRGLEERPYFVRDDEMIALAHRGSAASAAHSSGRTNRFGLPPEVFLVPELPHSEDIRPIGLETSGTFRFLVTGSDPNFGLPLPRGFKPAEYRFLRVTLAFPDADSTTRPDTIDLIFRPTGDDRAPVTCTLEFVPGSQFQTVTFDLSQVVEWHLAESLVWLRLDPCTRYRGRVDVRDVLFE
ncbi:MAG: glycosyltransferase family 39 protein [Candidatus Sumerlaeia bacterium]|nr:glycosyltransferase family 39 protein [Candidatus Sumerlaeia bacterium]